jgi:hypothetical protein
MAYEAKPGTFTLFKNEYRTNENKQPHYRGRGLDLNGQPIEVSAWVKTSEGGKQFMSCVFKLYECMEKQESKQVDEVNDLPF